MKNFLMNRDIVSFCVLFAVASLVSAQPTDSSVLKSVRVVRTDVAPVIDGVLDEEVWEKAGKVTDFYEVSPDEYDEAAELTEVFILYDSTNLYIAAKLSQSQPNEITAQVLRQGSGLWGDDYFGVILDPFNNRRNGYLFQLNPNGVRAEALYENTTQTQFDWVGIWQGRTSIQKDGWIAEMSIPFRTLSFDPENDTWGINFTRQIARTHERIGWVSRTRAQNPGIAGVAVGFDGLDQGRGIDILTSLSVRNSKEYVGGSTTTEKEPSVDVFYKFTPALTGVMTVNTDFAATEIDDRQVNLTRYSLFFPEKRDFFLQDADIFEFGGIGGGRNNFGRGGSQQGQNGRPFFSRKIGLSASREPVDIDVGAKLTGRIGRWNVGLLDVQQDASETTDAVNLFVGRGVANVLEESRVGFILTDGDPQSGLDNTLLGIDFRYLNTRLPSSRTAEGKVWYQQSDTPGLEGNDTAFGLGFNLNSLDKLDGSFSYAELGENFNPALGFVSRVGVRDYSANLNYTHRPRGKFYRSLTGGLSFSRGERLVDGSIESESLDLRLNLYAPTGDRISATCSTDKEGLIRPFTILRGRDSQPDVVIPKGLYEFDKCRIEGNTGNQRKLSGRLTYESGDFYDGKRTSIRPSITWRPSEHFGLEIQYQYNDIVLPYGVFTSRLTRLRSDVVFSSTLSWVNLLQWDNTSDVLGINSRLHWIPQAGREIYLVLNQNLQDLDENGSFHSLDSDLTAKLNYTFRF